MSSTLPDVQPEPRVSAIDRLPLPLQARLRLALNAVTWVVPLLTVLVAVSEWNGIPRQPLRDTSAYYLAGEAARSGGDIYDPLPPAGPHDFQGQRYYLYPPPLAALLGLFPPTSLRTFDRIWLCSNIAALWLFAASLGRIATGRWEVRSTLRWGAATFFLPGAWLAIHFGNIEMIVLALVALGLAWPSSAGAWLYTAAVFKVSPLWPFLVRSVRLPRATLMPAGVAAFISVAVCVAVFGAVETVVLSQRWVRDVMPAVSQGQFWGGSLPMLLSGLDPVHYISNLSPSFMPVQVAVLNGWDYDGGDLPKSIRAYLTAVAVAGPLVAAWFTRGRSANVQTAIVYVAALFSAPIVRPYVLPVLLLVIATLHQEARQERVTA